MANPVTDPAILAQLNGGKQPVSDPALLAQLNGEGGPQFNLSDAVTDIPAEIKRTAMSNAETIAQGFEKRGEKGPIEGLLSTGKALAAIPTLIASPITGAARSLGGHTMAWATHKIGELIAPEIAAKDDPQKMYENAAGDVEKAMMAARPAGPRVSTAVPAPTVAELKTASRAGYNAPEVAAVEINPQSTARLSSTIENDLLQRGFRERLTPAVFDEVRALTPPQGVASVRVADIDSARKALGIMARERDAVGQPTAQAAAARTAVDHINDYLPNIGRADVIAGDPVRASEIMREAIGNWAAAKRAEKVDLQLTRADRQAAKSGSGSNIENAMRQKIATILDNPRQTVGFNAAEREAMEQIVRGSVPRNALRKAGKLGVDGGLSLLLNTGAALGSGGSTIPFTVAATGARKVGEALTARAGRQLSEAVRNRSPLASQNQRLHAVQQALLPPPRAGAAQIPYAAIVAAMLQQQQAVRR